MGLINGPFADTREMHKVHTMFRREFGLLPSLVREVAAGDEERPRIVADHIKLLCMVLEIHHQSEDDFLWPKLLERGSHEVPQVVHLTKGHHELIGELLAELHVQLQVWLDSVATARRDAVGDSLGRINALLKEHMGLEEERILPIVEKYVTAAEWGEMVQNELLKLRPEDIPLIAGMVMYEAGSESGPPDVGVAMRDLATKAFASYSKRIHGTPTPPRVTGCSWHSWALL